jgi:adenosylhomocysteine nucleosidase
MKIGLMAALEQELGGIRAQLIYPKNTTLGLREYICGQFGQHELVTVLARMGKVAAASTATTLIQHFNVDVVVFIGLAGGIGDDIQVGDIVVATQLAQHDLNASPFFPCHQVPLLEKTWFECHPDLSESLHRAAQIAIQDFEFSKNGTIQRKPTVYYGPILSGDQFIAQQTQHEQLRHDFPEALAVEMEGAAVAQICYEWKKPFAVIRTISDRADHHAHHDFHTFLKHFAAPLAQDILNNWLNHPL